MTSFRTYNLFSPPFFIIAFSISFLLYTLKLSKSIEGPSVELLLYVLLSLGFFILGLFLSSIVKISKSYTPQCKKRISPSVAWIGILISTSLYFFEHVSFFLQYGNVPLLLPNAETLRFNFMVNGYVHLLAMMGRIWLLIIVAIHLHNNVPLKRSKKVALALFITLLFDILVGNRGEFLMLLCLLAILTSFYKNFTRQILVLTLLAIVVLGLGKTMRDYAMYGNSSLIAASQDWVWGESFISISIYNLYMTISYNFHILNSYIKNIEDFFYGYFTIVIPLIDPLPVDTFSIKELQAQVLGIHFHGALTSTILSFPFIDYGYLGSIYMFYFGFIGQVLFRLAKASKSPMAKVLYAYFALNLFLGIYTYMFNQFYIILNFFIILVYPFVSNFPSRKKGLYLNDGKKDERL